MALVTDEQMLEKAQIEEDININTNNNSTNDTLIENNIISNTNTKISLTNRINNIKNILASKITDMRAVNNNYTVINKKSSNINTNYNLLKSDKLFSKTITIAGDKNTFYPIMFNGLSEYNQYFKIVNYEGSYIDKTEQLIFEANILGASNDYNEVNHLEILTHIESGRTHLIFPEENMLVSSSTTPNNMNLYLESTSGFYIRGNTTYTIYSYNEDILNKLVTAFNYIKQGYIKINYKYKTYYLLSLTYDDVAIVSDLLGVANPIFDNIGQDDSIIKPSVLSPTENSELPITNFNITTSAFTTINNTDTLFSVGVQIATDINFTEIIYYKNYGPETTLSVTEITLISGQNYYIRVSHVGTKLGSSEWSDPIKILVNENIYINTPSIIVPNSGYEINDYTQPITLTGSNFNYVSVYDITHTESHWIISTDGTFNTIDEEYYINTGDLTKLTIPDFVGLADEINLYVKVRYKGSGVTDSSWSDFSGSYHLYLNIPTVIDTPNIELSESNITINDTHLLPLTFSTLSYQYSNDLTHISTDIQIASNNTFTLDLIEINITENLNNYTVNFNDLLDKYKDYYIRIKYNCLDKGTNISSPYSDYKLIRCELPISLTKPSMFSITPAVELIEATFVNIVLNDIITNYASDEYAHTKTIVELSSSHLFDVIDTTIEFSGMELLEFNITYDKFINNQDNYIRIKYEVNDVYNGISQSDYSNYKRLYINYFQGISTPSIISPNNEEIFTSTYTPTIRTTDFNTINVTDTHELTRYEVALDIDFVNIVYIKETDTDLTEHILESMLYSETYYVRVKHKGVTYGWSTYSQIISFTINVTLIIDKPSIIYPSDLYIEKNSYNIDFISSALSSPNEDMLLIESHWQICDSADFIDNTIDIFNTSIDKLTQPINCYDYGLSEREYYYFRVRHKGNDGLNENYSPWSDAIKVQYDYTLFIERPEIVNPIEGSIIETNQLQLVGSVVDMNQPTASLTYTQVQISTDIGFINIFLEKDILADTLDHCDTLISGDELSFDYWNYNDYFIRFRYVNDNGTVTFSEWSSPVGFRWEAPWVVDKPTILSPTNNESLPRDKFISILVSSISMHNFSLADFVSSTYQINDSIDFTGNFILDTTVTENKLEYIIPTDLNIPIDIPLYIRVRFNTSYEGKNISSDYSDIITINIENALTIATPGITTPVGTIDSNQPIVIQGTTFNPSNIGIIHTASKYQLSTDNTFNTIDVCELYSTTDLTSITLPDTVFIPYNTPIYIRIQYSGIYDNSIFIDSDWSNIVSFDTNTLMTNTCETINIDVSLLNNNRTITYPENPTWLQHNLYKSCILFSKYALLDDTLTELEKPMVFLDSNNNEITENIDIHFIKNILKLALNNTYIGEYFIQGIDITSYSDYEELNYTLTINNKIIKLEDYISMTDYFTIAQDDIINATNNLDTTIESNIEELRENFITIFKDSFCSSFMLSESPNISEIDFNINYEQLDNTNYYGNFNTILTNLPVEYNTEEALANLIRNTKNDYTYYNVFNTAIKTFFTDTIIPKLLNKTTELSLTTRLANLTEINFYFYINGATVYLEDYIDLTNMYNTIFTYSNILTPTTDQTNNYNRYIDTFIWKISSVFKTIILDHGYQVIDIPAPDLEGEIIITDKVADVYNINNKIISITPADIVYDVNTTEFNLYLLNESSGIYEHHTTKTLTTNIDTWDIDLETTDLVPFQGKWGITVKMSDGFNISNPSDMVYFDSEVPVIIEQPNIISPILNQDIPITDDNFNIEVSNMTFINNSGLLDEPTVTNNECIISDGITELIYSSTTNIINIDYTTLSVLNSSNTLTVKSKYTCDFRGYTIESDYSEPRSFTISYPQYIEKPIINSPVSGYTFTDTDSRPQFVGLEPTIFNAPTESLTNIEYIVSSDIEGTNIIQNEIIDTNITTFKVVNKLPNSDTGMYIKIRYKSTTLDWSEWSDPLMFKLDTPVVITTPNVTSPINESTIFPTVTTYPLNVIGSNPEVNIPNFTHTKTHYQIATDIDFTNITNEETLTNSLTNFNTNITTDGTYYIRLRYEIEENISTPVTYWSEFSPVVSCTILFWNISKPSITNLTNGKEYVTVNDDFTITTSDFIHDHPDGIGAVTYVETEWDISDGNISKTLLTTELSATLINSYFLEFTNKDNISFRIRYKGTDGTNVKYSEWSDIITVKITDNIGIQTPSILTYTDGQTVQYYTRTLPTFTSSNLVGINTSNIAIQKVYFRIATDIDMTNLIVNVAKTNYSITEDPGVYPTDIYIQVMHEGIYLDGDGEQTIIYSEWSTPLHLIMDYVLQTNVTPTIAIPSGTTTEITKSSDTESAQLIFSLTNSGSFVTTNVSISRVQYYVYRDPGTASQTLIGNVTKTTSVNTLYYNTTDEGTFKAQCRVELTNTVTGDTVWSNWSSLSSGTYTIEVIMKQIITCGDDHTVGLKTNGTCVVTGDNTHGQSNTSSWTNIIQIDCSDRHTVGLKSNGTCVAVGETAFGQCNVSSWTNIKQIAAGEYNTVALKTNGTCVAVGNDSHGQLGVTTWTNIKQIACGTYHTVGLKEDGTVVAVGYNAQGQCNISSWTNIKQIACGHYCTVGLKEDGTVLINYSEYGNPDVSTWNNIVYVDIFKQLVIGVKSNGTCVSIGNYFIDDTVISSWTNIVQAAIGSNHAIGVKSNGTCVAVGNNSRGQCNVSSWDLF
jgi:alpha-tubulin suppressor-like RCC1 family protein